MGGTKTKQASALGLSKATHEFFTLHYFAIDSAAWWEQILVRSFFVKETNIYFHTQRVRF